MKDSVNTSLRTDWRAPYTPLERLIFITFLVYSVLTVGLWNDLSRPVRLQSLNMAMVLGAALVPHITWYLGQVAVDVGRMVLVIFTCLISYEWVAAVIDVLPPRSYELQALQLDALLFRGNPSEWLQAVHHPALTEYFQIVYVGYFPTLLLVGVALFLERKRDVLLTYSLALASAVVFNHFCYALVPIRSPFLVADQLPYSGMIRYDFPLQGLWYAETLRQSLLNATQMRFDCFPSGHTMHSLIAVFFAWRCSSRWVSFLATFLCLSIITSTLYLRYHYGVDLLAGAAGAGMFTWLAVRTLRGTVDPSDRLQGAVASLNSLAAGE